MNEGTQVVRETIALWLAEVDSIGGRGDYLAEADALLARIDAAVMESKPARRRRAAQAGAEASWANTADRSARTAPARAKFDQRFLDDAGGDPVRAARLRRAHFAGMAAESAKVRRAKRAAREDA